MSPRLWGRNIVKIAKELEEKEVKDWDEIRVLIQEILKVSKDTARKYSDNLYELDLLRINNSRVEIDHEKLKKYE